MSQGMIANNRVIWQLLVQPRSYRWHNGRNQRDPVKENPANIIQLSSLDDCGLVLGSTVWGVTTRALNVSWTAFPGVRWQSWGRGQGDLQTLALVSQWYGSKASRLLDTRENQIPTWVCFYKQTFMQFSADKTWRSRAPCAQLCFSKLPRTQLVSNELVEGKWEWSLFKSVDTRTLP